MLGQDLFTELWLNFKISEHVIKADDGPFKMSTTPMVYLGTYVFKDLNTVKLHLNNRLPIITSTCIFWY